jgi:hypothetical protein
VEVKMLARLDLAAGTDEGGPIFAAEVLGEQDFDASAGERRAFLRVQARTGSVETSGNDATVVEDEQVARNENFREIAEEVIAVFTALAIESKHTAGAANRWRRLGNEFFGKIELEVGYAH